MNKTVLITGANGMLGTEVVKNLHSKGYSICAAVGSGELPESFTKMTIHTKRANLTDEASAQQYVEEITRLHPGLNAAALLVGGFAVGGIADTDAAMLDKQIALNFKTAYFVARPLLAHFEQNGGGRFVFIGSRPALKANEGKGLVAYALAKSMVFHLAEIINETGKGKGISATVLVPSTIDTEANRKAMPQADFSKWVKSEDIAETIAFVLSDTGQALRETILKIYNEA